MQVNCAQQLLCVYVPAFRLFFFVFLSMRCYFSAFVGWGSFFRVLGRCFVRELCDCQCTCATSPVCHDWSPPFAAGMLAVGGDDETIYLTHGREKKMKPTGEHSHPIFIFFPLFSEAWIVVDFCHICTSVARLI